MGGFLAETLKERQKRGNQNQRKKARFAAMKETSGPREGLTRAIGAHGGSPEGQLGPVGSLQPARNSMLGDAAASLSFGKSNLLMYSLLIAMAQAEEEQRQRQMIAEARQQRDPRASDFDSALFSSLLTRNRGTLGGTQR